MPSILYGQKPAARFIATLEVVLMKGEDCYVAETKNVSDMGLCLSPREVFPVGTQLHLVFGQPPGLPRLSAEGIVRWSEGGKGVGVEFTSIRRTDYMALRRFVTSQYRSHEV